VSVCVCVCVVKQDHWVCQLAKCMGRGNNITVTKQTNDQCTGLSTVLNKSYLEVF